MRMLTIQSGVLVMLCLCVLSCKGVNPKGRITEVQSGDVLLVPSTFTDEYSRSLKVRLLAIRCPNEESDSLIETYYAALAKQQTEKWCDKKLVVLERPILKSNGRIDRHLVFVKDSESGNYLHEMLLKKGLAEADFQGRVFPGKNEKIKELEAQAREKNLGQWSKEHPPEYEMRALINDSHSLLKKISNAVLGKKAKSVKTEEKPIAKSTVTPVEKTKERVSVIPQSLTLALQRMETLKKAVFDKYAYWETSSSTEKVALAQGLRDDLRHIKIQIEDILDDYEDKLSEAKKTELKNEQKIISKKMKIVKNSHP